MSLDPRYIPLTTIWQLFTDKDTGDFLRNGYVKFWIDTNRTIGKPVYKLTGSPPNYSYIEYGTIQLDGSWRVEVDDQGALDDIPYAFPYDADGNVQLYFIKVYSADNVEQFSREGLPNVAGSGPSDTTTTDINYVPNPQFLLHLDLPKTSTLQAGQVRAPITDIAWGGWTYERPAGSTATDFVTFERFGSDVITPDKSPRYSLRVECQSPSPGDIFKDIRLKFRDVNKFSSSIDSFTFSFQAQVNAGGALSASIILIKNFGTGGSLETEDVLQTITIGSSWTLFPINFMFGENTSQTLGTLNDDYLELVIRLPVDSIFDVSFDSYNLALGNILTPTMPYTTDSEMIYRSIAGFMPIPNPDGSDLYLYPRLTPTGMEFDRSDIGYIYASSKIVPDVSYLNCDGASYEYNSYSTDKIPYKRIGDVLWDNINNFYKFGTGINYSIVSQVGGATQNIKLTNNGAGSVTSTADGSMPTGFTFNTIKTGATTYGFTSNKGVDAITVRVNIRGVLFANPSAGTSGFTVRLDRASPIVYGLIGILSITPAAGLAGKYFSISNTTTTFYVWFKVDGIGTDPAPGGTGIEIDLLSSYTSDIVGQAISDALTGRQISNISCTAASSISAGSFWIFDSLSQGYYVWYKKDGSGTDPAPSGKIGIEVDILSSDTNSEVALKTMIVINRKYFATPDMRGLFIRGIDSGSNIDPDVVARFNIFSSSSGDQIGTLEFDDIIQHSHEFFTTATPADFSLNNLARGNSIDPGVFDTSYSGGFESRPINIYLNYVIRY